MDNETSPDGQPQTTTTQTPAPAGQQTQTPAPQAPQQGKSPLFQPQPQPPATTPPGQGQQAPEQQTAESKPSAEADDELDADDPDDEPIRNRKDVDKLIKRRDALKAENERLKKQLADNERAGRRAKNEAAILDGVRPEHQEQVRLMLPGLAEAGDIDLYSEHADAAKNARDKLAKRFPAFYAAQADAPVVSPPGDRRPRSFEGVKSWNDLTPEEQRALPKEDFERMFLQGQRGGISALFRQQRS